MLQWPSRGVAPAVAALALLVMLGAQFSAERAAAFNIKKVEGSVYKIYTWRFNAKKGMGAGTGFLVSGHRTLITNYHVVVGGEKFFIGYRDGSVGKLVEARVIERRSQVDLAVLEAYEDLPGEPLPLGNYEPEKLASVVAVGFPGAAEVKEDPKVRSIPELLQAMKEPSGFDPTITPGTVSRIYSATNATLSDQQVINARTVQHNAAINPGNSGGPLLDACTAVIGVNSFFPKGAQGVFFSIHAGEVIRFLHDLNIHDKVSGPCLTSSLSASSGLLLPFLIAMSTLLALAALLFALRYQRNPFGAIGHYAQRLSEMGKVTELAGRFAPRGWSAVSDVASLQAVGGERAHTLVGGKAISLGRSKACAIVVTDDTVSMEHARLLFDHNDQSLTVTDLGSSNGTFLNGARVTTTARARAGDVLRFGSAEFRVAAGAQPATPPGRHTTAKRGWMLSGFDPAGRALQFELRPGNGRAGGGEECWVVGRDPARAQFIIEDDSVSGAHAEFAYRDAQGLSLRDLGSTNGTRVNGQALGSRTIALGDAGQEIAFGVAKLRLSRLLA